MEYTESDVRQDIAGYVNFQKLPTNNWTNGYAMYLIAIQIGVVNDITNCYLTNDR